jgi:hypothetical protein
MVLGLIMMLLSTIPFVLVGVAALVLQANADAVVSQVLNNPAFANAGVTAQSILSFLKIVGAIIAVIGLLYAVFAVLGFLGKNWARIVAAIMSALFGIFLVFVAIGSSSDASSLIFVLALLVLCVGGVVTYFLRDSNSYFAAVRRTV